MADTTAPSGTRNSPAQMRVRTSTLHYARGHAVIVARACRTYGVVKSIAAFALWWWWRLWQWQIARS